MTTPVLCPPWASLSQSDNLNVHHMCNTLNTALSITLQYTTHYIIPYTALHYTVHYQEQCNALYYTVFNCTLLYWN